MTISGMPVEIPSDISKHYVPLPFSDCLKESRMEKKDVRLLSPDVIQVMIRRYNKTSVAWEMLLNEEKISVLWDMAGYMTTEKLGMNDHGRNHALVTAASSLKILDILHKSGINPDIVESGMGELDDAFLIVLMSSLCHDIGNSIHRSDHLYHSINLALPILDKILPQIYNDPSVSMQIRLFILSSINSHHGDPAPLTIEGSIVSIADASDMTKGRAFHSRDMTKASIHAISTLSIDQVNIIRGQSKPVEIQITLSHIAGMYQIQETLIPKIKAGIIGKHVSVYIPLLNQYIY